MLSIINIVTRLSSLRASILSFSRIVPNELGLLEIWFTYVLGIVLDNVFDPEDFEFVVNYFIVNISGRVCVLTERFTLKKQFYFEL